MSETAIHQVQLYSITQATTATFTEMFMRLAFLFFIVSGSKRVVTATQDIVGEEGDLLVFPAGSMVTMENRPVFNADYHAVGVSFSDKLVAEVFKDHAFKPGSTEVQILRAETHRPADILPIIQDTLDRSSLPEVILRQRLKEPLLWLRENGVQLATSEEESPLSRVRRIIETDLSHPWRAGEVAGRLAMSEATMRRWLADAGHGFAKTLMNTRLEHGLGLLQTTDVSISEIALECGFKTPSHFSDAFRKRFGIAPKHIRAAAA
ncbi:MAG: AraC family transcriptional regulator [Pseudomonadota bacterium]